MASRQARWATVGGLASIGIWSTSISVSRLVTEDLGVLPASSLVLLAAGALLFAITSVRERGVGWLKRLAPKHLAICGPLFIGYILLLYVAVGVAPTRLDALIAGLANYLWPTMILVFSVLILKHRARHRLLVPGVVLSLAGILLASSVTLGGWRAMLSGLAGVPWFLAIGLIAALLWGLYSVLARVHRQTVSSGAVAVFLLVAGLVALIVSRGQWAESIWSTRAMLSGVYMAIFPNSVAYWLWDVAVRDGDVATLGAVSNLIPVLSTLVGTAVLAIGLRWELIGGAVVVVLGAALSRVAFSKAKQAHR